MATSSLRSPHVERQAAAAVVLARQAALRAVESDGYKRKERSKNRCHSQLSADWRMSGFTIIRSFWPRPPHRPAETWAE